MRFPGGLRRGPEEETVVERGANSCNPDLLCQLHVRESGKRLLTLGQGDARTGQDRSIYGATTLAYLGTLRSRGNPRHVEVRLGKG